MREALWMCLASLIGLSCGANDPAPQVTEPTWSREPANSPPMRLRARVVASFPVGTFLENIVIGAKGDAFVTSYLEGRIYRIAPSGARSIFATFPGTIAGIVRRPVGGFLVAGWRDGTVPSVFHVSEEGTVGEATPIAGALFPNGMAHLGGSRYLVADSYRGVIWQYDDATGRAAVWLADPLLSRADTSNPTPGVNGVRRTREAVYLTNTQRQLILRVPVNERGEPGKPTVHFRGVNVDDFAIDRDGRIYAATHVLNSVIRVDVSGAWMTIAGIDDYVAGSTSVALVRHARSTSLLVTTNGGMSAPPPGGVQEGRLVALELNGGAGR